MPAEDSMTASISRDEWLKALDEARGPTDQEAITIREFAAMCGLSLQGAAGRMTLLVTSGRAVKTAKNVDEGGRVVRRPAYRLVKDAKGKR